MVDACPFAGVSMQVGYPKILIFLDYVPILIKTLLELESGRKLGKQKSNGQKRVLHAPGTRLLAGGTRRLLLCSHGSAARFAQVDRGLVWADRLRVGTDRFVGLETGRVHWRCVAPYCWGHVAPTVVRRVAPTNAQRVSSAYQATLHQLTRGCQKILLSTPLTFG